MLPKRLNLEIGFYRGRLAQFKMFRAVIEQDLTFTFKKRATTPGVTFWSEGKRGQIWWLAQRRPGVGLFPVIGNKIQKILTITRNIAASFINMSFQPLSLRESVSLSVPAEKLNSFGRSTSEDCRFSGFCGQQNEQSSRYGLDAHQDPLSSFSSSTTRVLLSNTCWLSVDRL